MEQTTILAPSSQIEASRHQIGPSGEGQRPSLRGSINAKCKECIYDHHAGGTWREQVTACTSYACPLFAVRPLARKSLEDDEP